jgi:hypothetical protein
MSTTTETSSAAADIAELCARHNVPHLAAPLLREGGSLEQARDRVLHELALRDAAAGGHHNTIQHSRAQQPPEQRELMLRALCARLGVGDVDTSNPYTHCRVADMARDCLELVGINTRTMTPAQLVERGLHTTSDFPNLLQGAGQRVLRRAYETYAGGLRRVCRESSARDFRAKQSLKLSEAPALLKVGEHSEFKHGSMVESKESYALATFGRIFGITRQALVNDDLGAFGDMATRLGRAAIEFESQFLVNLLTSNPTMGDTIALFHASHSNLATGAGSALSLTSLTAARKAMRLQKGLDGATPIDATPRFLVVPAALETTAEQLVAEIQPTTLGDVNPFAGRLEVVTDPRLDANSSTAWYLAAEPSVIDTIEYSYLESAGGPEVITQEGFEVDGVQMKVRLDYGAGVLDFRGLYKAAGA